MKLSGKTINNRYHVLNKSGEDFLSVFWKAEELSSKKNVTLRFLKHENNFYRIEDLLRLKKASTLASHLNHPNITSIFEINEFAGLASGEDYTYLTTEFISGPTLSDYLTGAQKAKDISFTLDMIIGLIEEISTALKIAHENHLVHQDFNPEHIWLSLNASRVEKVKIAGFGFVELKELSKITEPEDIISTFSYMSPEASGIIKEKIDERSDLYSLGIICYQLLTGCLPFTGDNVETILHKSIAMSPPLPSKINHEISTELDRIILKLLKKDKEERYQSVTGLIADLKKIQNGETDFELAMTDQRAKLNLKMGVVGRERELTLLKELFNKCFHNKGRLCLVTGETGIGKTPLIEELRAYVINKGGLFISGTCSADKNKMPYKVFHAILDDFLKNYYRHNVSRQEQELLRLRQIVGDMGEIILNINPDMKKILGAVPALVQLNETDRENDRFLNVSANFFRHLGEARAPIVLFLDDLHWADEGSLSLLAEIVFKIEQYPLLILGTWGGNLTTDEHPGIQGLKEKQASITEIKLDLFDSEKATSLITHILSTTESKIPKKFLDYVIHQSNGSPFSIVEILRHLEEEKVVYAGTEGWQFNLDKLDQLTISSNIVDMLLKRMELLSQTSINLISQTAVIGFSFELDHLYKLSGLSQEETLNIVDQAVDLHFLERDFSTKGKLQFVHESIREAFYNLMSEEERKATHLKFARVIEEVNQDNIEQELFNLADHYINSEHQEKSLEYAIPAGNKAKDNYANKEAGQYYQAAFKLLEETGEKGSRRWLETLDGLAEIYIREEKSEEAFEILNQLLPYKKNNAGKVNIYKMISQVHFNHGNWDKCLAYGIEGFKLLGEKVPTRKATIILGLIKELFIFTLHNLFPIFFNRSREHPKAQKYKKIIEIYYPLTHSLNLLDILRINFRTINLAESKIGPSKELAACQAYLGAMFMAIPVFSKALTFHKKAISLRRQINDQWGHAQSAQFLGLTHEFMGEFNKSVEYFSSAVNLYQKTGDSREQALSLSGFLRIHNHLGNYDLVETYTIKNAELIESVKDPFVRLGFLFNNIRFQMGKGNYEEAEAWGKKVFDLSREKKLWMFFNANIILADLALERGDIEQSLKYLDLARRLDEEKRIVVRYFANYIHNYYAEAYIGQFLSEPDMNGDKKKALLNKIKQSCREALKKNKLFPYHYCIALKVNAKYFALIGKNNKAERFFADSIKLANSLGTKYELGKIYFEFGCYFDAINKDEKAKKKWQSAYQIFETIGAIAYLKKTADYLGIKAREETYREKLVDKRRLASIIAISQDISSIMNIEKLLAKVVAKAIEVTGAMRGHFFILNEETGRLELKATKDIEAKASKTNDLTYSEALINDVFKTNIPLITHNAPNDNNLKKYKDFNLNTHKSILCVPMKVHEKKMGVFYLDNRLSGSVFTKDDIEILNVFLAQAAISIENAFVYMLLDDLVKMRTAELEDTQKELVDKAHKAGQADIATALLHNVGNILTNVTTSGEMITQTIKDSKLEGFYRANNLLKKNMENIEEFIANNPKGKKLFNYYFSLEEVLREENETISSHTKRLLSNINTIKEVIMDQLDHIDVDFLSEELDITVVIDNALKIHKDSFLMAGIQIEKNYQNIPEIAIQKSKLMNIIFNLIQNACEALSRIDSNPKKITISTCREKDAILVKVADTGCGIAEENLTKIFQHEFSTEDNRQGFGLHDCANYMSEMKGRMWAESQGPGKGATFTLSFPL